MSFLCFISLGSSLGFEVLIDCTDTDSDLHEFVYIHQHIRTYPWHGRRLWVSFCFTLLEKKGCSRVVCIASCGSRRGLENACSSRVDVYV